MLKTNKNNKIKEKQKHVKRNSLKKKTKKKFKCKYIKKN